MVSLGDNVSRFLRSFWGFLTELPLFVTYERRSVHNRSIVRAIGTILPLPPAPRVFFNLAAWNPDLERFTNSSGCEVVSPKAHDSSKYQRQIDELQEELKVIKDKLSLLLEKEAFIKLELAISKEESNVCNVKTSTPPPPPPPPPPMPDLNIVSSKPPRIKRSKRNNQRCGPQSNADALHLVISQLVKEKPKLRHVERSPGGRPIKPKREPEVDPNDILAQALRKRYSALQESSDAESFNASFTDISSPIKSTIG